eukprot:scaffold7246_cov114-Isochrysis_galbana.AAC.2
MPLMAGMVSVAASAAAERGRGKRLCLALIGGGATASPPARSLPEGASPLKHNALFMVRVSFYGSGLAVFPPGGAPENGDGIGACTPEPPGQKYNC